MPIDHRVASRETREVPGVMNQPDCRLFNFEDPSRGQQPLQPIVVHVPVHGLERPDPSQLLVDLGRDEITRMQDQVRGLEAAQALRR